MPGSLVPWIIAALAAIAAVFSFVRLRSAQQSLRESQSEVAALEEKLRIVAKRAETRSAGQRRHDDELAELRRKLEKAKKRASQAREEQLADSHRIKELEERLRLRGADGRATRAAANPPVAVAASPPAPKPRVEKPAVEKPAPAPKAPPVGESEALATAVQRVQRAEAERDASQQKLSELVVQLKRQQGKARTHDKLYASMRLELEAKKDRLGAQQEELERLRALKVALMESPAEVAPPRAGEDAALETAPSTAPSE